MQSINKRKYLLVLDFLLDRKDETPKKSKAKLNNIRKVISMFIYI